MLSCSCGENMKVRKTINLNELILLEKVRMIYNEKYDGMGYVVAKNVSEVKPKELAKMGLDEALSRIGGKSIPSGKYKVIINNEAMVSLLGTFDSIFDSEQAQKGLSLLNGKEG